MTAAPREKVPLDDFRQCPLMQDSLPVRFKNGARMTEFTGHCIDCKKPIPVGEMRGTVEPMNMPAAVQPYRDVPTGTVDACWFEVRGYCKACNLLTPFKYGVAGVGGGFEMFAVRENNLLVWSSARLPWWRRALNLVFRWRR